MRTKKYCIYGAEGEVVKKFSNFEELSAYVVSLSTLVSKNKEVAPTEKTKIPKKSSPIVLEIKKPVVILRRSGTKKKEAKSSKELSVAQVRKFLNFK